MIFKRSVYVDFHEQVWSVLVVIKTHTAKECIEVPQSRLTKSSDKPGKNCAAIQKENHYKDLIII